MKIKVDDLKIKLSQRLGVVPSLEQNIPFGYYVSDYMLEFDFENGQWDRPLISPYHSLAIDPCNTTLHYGIELYEGTVLNYFYKMKFSFYLLGLKAYKDSKGNIRLFRPEMNCTRLLNSAKRICLPMFDTSEFLKCLSELLKLEQRWIPTKKGYSLYIRPCFISMSVSYKFNFKIESIRYSPSKGREVICSHFHGWTLF